MTVSQQYKRRLKKHQQQGIPELVVEEDCADPDTSTYVKNVVTALKLGNGEIMLAIAWVTADGRRYHQMFPRVMGMDVKYGTNNERRPLLRFIGRTGNNRNYNIMNCYMPSEQQYAYAWAVGTALSFCLDEAALTKTSLILTDEDKDEMDAVLSILMSSDKVLGLALLRLCKWHKVSKSFTTNIRIYTFAHPTQLLSSPSFLLIG